MGPGESRGRSPGASRGWAPMTNQEINEAVARRLGWEELHPNHGLLSKKIGANQYVSGPIPNYCTDIAAAWEIVEKNPKYFSVSWDDDAEKWNAGWFEIEALADTPAMATCLAFLKLEETK